MNRIDGILTARRHAARPGQSSPACRARDARRRDLTRSLVGRTSPRSARSDPGALKQLPRQPHHAANILGISIRTLRNKLNE